MTQPLELDATGQLELLATGELSCVELIDAHLERIDQLNPSLNALSTTLHESARTAAQSADAKAERGPLHGLPFSVKQDIDCFGSPTTHGVVALKDALPYADAPVVGRLKAAGAIAIARGNLSEMGLRLSSDNPLHGRTLNPHDPSRTAGGSSGGDAVAVATGMTPLGIGGDTGGSLRLPAACNGCVALKPTTGRIPHASSLPPRDYGLCLQLMLAIGPLVRSVRDLRLILPIIAGRDIRDPRSVDVPLKGPAPSERTAAIVTSLPGTPLDAESRRAVERAAQILVNAGWQVEEAAPPDLNRVQDVFINLLTTEFEISVHQLQPVISDSLFEYLMRLCGAKHGRELTQHNLHTERSRLLREWSGFFTEYPVLIGPNLASPIWTIDADLHPETGIPLVTSATRFITPGNALGIPSLALPMGMREGLPTSILIYADLWREDLCLDTAELVEQGLRI